MPSKKELIKFWLDRSEDDRITAKTLLETKRYSASLFFTHIFLEKILKALVVEKTGNPAPHTHDLLNLASIAEIILSDEQKDVFREINTFNIASRYDDYKQEFYKKAAKEYTAKYFSEANKLYLWLARKFTQK